MHPVAQPFGGRRAFLRDGAGLVGGWVGLRNLARADTVASHALPSWAPALPGGTRVLATRNTFLSQNGALAGWESSFGKIVDDYSGGVFNPYWGPLGAMVFHGGGHSATFDNSVVLLDLNDLAFKRVSQPTPALSGSNWADARKAPGGDPAFDTLHCEYGDGQPGALLGALGAR